MTAQQRMSRISYILSFLRTFLIISKLTDDLTDQQPFSKSNFDEIRVRNPYKDCIRVSTEEFNKSPITEDQKKSIEPAKG